MGYYLYEEKDENSKLVLQKLKGQQVFTQTPCLFLVNCSHAFDVAQKTCFSVLLQFLKFMAYLCNLKECKVHQRTEVACVYS